MPRSTAKGIDTLYHDLDERPGAKFATADLIGIPWQILVGPRGLAEGKVEVKRRSDGTRELMTPADALARLASETGCGDMQRLWREAVRGLADRDVWRLETARIM